MEVKEAKIIMAQGVTFGVVEKYERGKKLQYNDEKKIIVVTDEDLTANDTLHFNWNKINGVITTNGTKNSHSAIVAKQHGVPAIVVNNIEDFYDDEDIALDVNEKEGKVCRKLNRDDIRELLKKIEIIKIQEENLSIYSNMENTHTTDGRRVMIVANIGNFEDAQKAVEDGAEGIGVFRSEFSYEKYDVEDRLPTEDELYEEYKNVSDIFKGKDIIIRTLDAGADKPINTLLKEGVLQENEINPALGSRGIRPYIENKEILKTQIKAILKANAENKNLQIMFPMITSIEEIQFAQSLVSEAIEELKLQGKSFSEAQIGIMVETPAVAQITDRLSGYCDFISVGTNDLSQYTMAADRMNSKVEHIANPYNLGMLRTLKNIINGAHSGKKNMYAGICGEIAGDLVYTPILIGMGVDELSMTSNNILKSKRLVSNLSFEKCEQLVNDILEKDTSKEIQDIVENFYKECNLKILKKEKEEREQQLSTTKEKETEAKSLEQRYYKLTGNFKMPDIESEGREN